MFNVQRSTLNVQRSIWEADSFPYSSAALIRVNCRAEALAKADARLFKEFLGAFEETLVQRRVLFATEIGKFLQFLSLLRIQLGGDFDDYADHQIPMAAAINIDEAFTAKLEHLTALRSGRHLQTRFSLKRGNGNIAAQRRH